MDKIRIKYCLNYMGIKKIIVLIILQFSFFRGESQPTLSFDNKIKLENFNSSNSVFYNLNVKICNNSKDKVYVIGFDTLLNNLHILSKNIFSGTVRDYFTPIPFKDSIKFFQITCANAIDSTLIFIVFDEKYLIYFRIYNDELILEKTSEINKKCHRLYHYYYAFGEKLYGIYPSSFLKKNDACYFLNDSLAVYEINDKYKRLKYYSKYFDSPFWHLGFSTYSVGYLNNIFIANALKNEIISFDLISNKVTKIKHPIKDYKKINKKFYKSIKEEFPEGKFDNSLSKIMSKEMSFNYIFKIIPRNKNEIWVIWRGGLPNPYNLKLDVIKFDSIEKKWINTGHDIYYSAKENDSIFSKYTFEVNPFHNGISLLENKLFFISSNKLKSSSKAKSSEDSKMDYYDSNNIFELIEYNITDN